MTPCSVGATTPQRPSFMTPSAKSLSNQPLLPKPGNDSFAPPFKKIDAAFSTPYRQDAQSAFKTPIKSSGGPDHLRKRLAYADQHSPQPDKKLKLYCGHQSELDVGTVTLGESARNMETKTGEKSAGNGDCDSDVRQNQEEGKTNVPPESSVVREKCCRLEAARESQLKRIEDKRSAQSVKPLAGVLFAMKMTSQRVLLKNAVAGATPGGHNMQQVRMIRLGFFQPIVNVLCSAILT